MFNSRRIATTGGDKFRDDFSVAFDGSNDHIDCGDVSDWDFSNGSASIFSVSAWFRSADGSPGSNDTIVSKYNTGDNQREWRVSVDDSARIKVFTSDNGTATDSAYTSFTVTDTNWHHVVFTYDGSVATAGLRTTLYVDGVNHGITIAGGTFTAILHEGNKPLTIGSFTSGGSSAENWNGSISEVAIYNSALSASQVKTLYNGREPYNHKEGIASGNLKAWWRMGDGLENHSGTTIYDMSNNSNNGTMTNMASDDFVGDTP